MPLGLGCSGLTGKEPIGAGTGGGEVAALICCQREREGRNTLLSRQAVRLPADLGKRKNIPSAICSQSGAGVGPGASCRSGSQTQFQNPRQLPPGLFWEAAQLRSTLAFLRGISHHSEAVCTRAPDCRLLLRPACPPFQPLSPSFFPHPPQPLQESDSPGWRGWGARDSQLSGGKGSLSASLLSSARPTASTAPQAPAGTPKASAQCRQGFSSLIDSSRIVPFVKAELLEQGGWGISGNG